MISRSIFDKGGVGEDLDTVEARDATRRDGNGQFPEKAARRLKGARGSNMTYGLDCMPNRKVRFPF